MMLSRRNVDQSNPRVGNLSFDKIDNFKYLGVNANSSNIVRRETNERMSNGNKCYSIALINYRDRNRRGGNRKLLCTQAILDQ